MRKLPESGFPASTKRSACPPSRPHAFGSQPFSPRWLLEPTRDPPCSRAVWERFLDGRVQGRGSLGTPWEEVLVRPVLTGPQSSRAWLCPCSSVLTCSRLRLVPPLLALGSGPPLRLRPLSACPALPCLPPTSAAEYVSSTFMADGTLPAKEEEEGGRPCAPSSVHVPRRDTPAHDLRRVPWICA